MFLMYLFFRTSLTLDNHIDKWEDKYHSTVTQTVENKVYFKIIFGEDDEILDFIEKATQENT